MLRKIYLFTLLTLVLFTSKTPSYASTFSERLDETRSSKVEKTFTVSKGDWLDLDMRFTDVTITTEEGINEVEVILVTDVSAKTAEEAEKLIKKLTGSVEKTGNRIKVKSTISEVIKSTVVNNEVKKIVFKDGTKFKFIKYEFRLKVNIPRHLNVEIDQDFGELYIGHLDGELILDSEYTSVQGESLNGKSKINAEFGELRFSNIKSGDIDLNYSTFRASSIENLNVDGDFSHYYLDKVGTMNSEGDYNTYEFEEIGNIDFDEDFSNLRIDKLIYNADLDMSYGTLKLRDVSPSFNSIDIRSEFTHVQIDLGSSINCELDVKYEMADLNINRASLKVHEDTKNEKERFRTSHNFRGTIGSGGDKKIEINASFGNVDIDID